MPRRSLPLALWVGLGWAACAPASGERVPVEPAAPAPVLPAAAVDGPADASVVEQPDASPDAPAPEDAAPAPRHPFHAPLPAVRELAATSPAVRIATLSPRECRAEAARRKLPVRRDGRPTPGVATAFRATGPFRGVTFHTAGPKSAFGVFDCRLALVFDEMAAVLVEHDVKGVIVGTIYRRGSKLGRRTPSQHAHGLAADVVAFNLTDGTQLSVERDWSGGIGEPACGAGSGKGVASDAAVRLRNLVCDLHARGLFHHVLTPGYDAAHRDHLHLDVKRGTNRAVIR